MAALGRCLPDPELQSVAFELELRQVVLPHQLEDLFDVVEFQSASESMALHLSRSLACQHFAAGCRHEHVVFDPNAADPLHIGARLDREDHPRFEQRVRLPVDRACAIRGSSCTSRPSPWPVP